MARAVKTAAKTAQKKAGRSGTTTRTATRVTGRKIPRVIAADGQAVVSKPPRLTAAERAAVLAEQIGTEDKIDTSFIVVDYQELRQKAIRAMGGDVENADPDDLVLVEGVKVVKGSFATQAKGPALAEQIKTQRKGSAAVLRIHPLDFHVLTGDDRMNTRDFSAPDMIEYVAGMTYDVANNGILEPAKVAIRRGIIAGIGGENRWRAAAHAWILKAEGLVANAPDRMPIILITGQNDGYLQLEVIKGNKVKNMKTLETAEGVKRSHKQGGLSISDIAKFMGEKESWVHAMLGYMEMPEQVHAIIRSGVVTVHVAAKAWQQENEDPARTVRSLEAAVKLAKLSKAKRVMPKHLVKGDEPVVAQPDPTPKAVDVVPEAPKPVVRSPSETQRDKLFRTLDDINAILANTSVRDNEDGTYDLIRISRDDIIKLARATGIELPESAKEDEALAA